MRAVVIEGYGGSDRLVVRERPDPVPGPGGLLIRVRAAGVNPVDWKIRKGMVRPFLPRRFPWVPGGDVAGEVAAVGPGVRRFREGDAVYAMIGAGTGGGYAELAVARESDAAAVPPAWRFEVAAAVPIAGLTALQSLRDLGRLVSGQSVLVTGASGGVGHLAVQVARAMNAGSVTATCGPANVEFVRGLGADAVLDYTRDDFTRSPARYDVILDAAAISSFTACLPVLNPRGHYVSTLPAPGLFAWSALGTLAMGQTRRAHFVLARASGEDLATLAHWGSERRLRPTVAEVFPLEQASRAHERSETEHTRGKLVLRVD